MQTAHKSVLLKPRKLLNIIEEYAALSPQRKLVLCDNYFVQGSESFETAVRLIWPSADEMDVKKLGNFLILLKNAAH